MRAVLLLFAAILFEVIASTSLKLSEGFTILIPSLTVFIAFIGAFFFLSLALKSILLSVAYAVWAGLGTALTAIAGILLFQESFFSLIIESLLTKFQLGTLSVFLRPWPLSWTL